MPGHLGVLEMGQIPVPPHGVEHAYIYIHSRNQSLTNSNVQVYTVRLV